MLTTFPTLLDYSFFAPFVLRLALGLIFAYSAYENIFKRRETFATLFSETGFPYPRFFMWTTSLLELIGGVCLIVGFQTQIAAILIAAISLCGLGFKLRRRTLLPQSASFYLLALAISLSLIVLGAGAFAVDLPL